MNFSCFYPLHRVLKNLNLLGESLATPLDLTLVSLYKNKNFQLLLISLCKIISNSFTKKKKKINSNFRQRCSSQCLIIWICLVMEYRLVNEEVGGNSPEIHCSRERSRAAWQIIQDVSRQWLNFFSFF